LAASHHSSTVGGQATCSWQLPKTAHGKRFNGSITVRFKGAQISRSFSARVT
jgi:hypothetical protein